MNIATLSNLYRTLLRVLLCVAVATAAYLCGAPLAYAQYEQSPIVIDTPSIPPTTAYQGTVDGGNNVVGWTSPFTVLGQCTAGGGGVDWDCTHWMALQTNTDLDYYAANLGGDGDFVMIGSCAEPSGTCFIWFEVLAGVLVQVYDPATGTGTRIISFTPADGEATSTDVLFTLHAYINADDIGTLTGYDINFSYQSQPLGVRHFLVDSVAATTSGDFYYSSEEVLMDGTYIVDVSMERSYLGGFFNNPLSSETITDFHQFSVGTTTLSGRMFQTGVTGVQESIDSLAATSSDALLASCGIAQFHFGYCISALFVPSWPLMKQGFSDFHDSILLRVPLGYITRTGDILLSSGTSTLPDLSMSFGGSFFITELASSTWSIPIGASMTSAAGILDTAVSNSDDPQNMREIVEPFVLLFLRLALLLLIIRHLGVGHTHGHSRSAQTKSV